MKYTRSNFYNFIKQQHGHDMLIIGTLYIFINFHRFKRIILLKFESVGAKICKVFSDGFDITSINILIIRVAIV